MKKTIATVFAFLALTVFIADAQAQRRRGNVYFSAPAYSSYYSPAYSGYYSSGPAYSSYSTPVYSSYSTPVYSSYSTPVFSSGTTTSYYYSPEATYSAPRSSYYYSPSYDTRPYSYGQSYYPSSGFGVYGGRSGIRFGW